MRFNRPVTAGLLALALSSLASRASARAIYQAGAVIIAHGDQSVSCAVGETDCIDSSSSQEFWKDRAIPKVWKKRAVPKGPRFGDDGEGLAGGESTGGITAGAGESSAGGSTSETGGTAGVGGIGEDDTPVTHGSAGDIGSPSDSGSKDSDASVGSQSSSDEDFPQGEVSQAPVDITTRGYGIFEDPNIENVFEVRIDSVDGPLDIIEVDRDNDCLGIIFANNKADESDGKLPLRAIAIDTWQQKSGKQIADLKGINYQSVIEPNMVEALPKAYDAQGVAFRTPITLTPDMPGFAIIMDTPFGGGATKMLAENAQFSGRSITSIDLFMEDGVDMQFNF